MRDLTNEPNVFKIRDGVSGEVKEFIYRTPTAMDHQAYAAKSLGLIGNKAVISRKAISEARVEFGLRILIGIKDNQFGMAGKPISSNPESPDYWEDWKELLKQYAPDLISLFAVAVLDGTHMVNNSNIEVEFKEDAEEVVPFGTSSAPSGSDAPRS
jgi:hypothetical protein